MLNKLIFLKTIKLETFVIPRAQIFNVEDYTVSDIASQKYFSISKEKTVADALEKFKEFNFGNDKSLYYIYILDGSKLVNVLSVQELLKTDKKQKLSNFKREKVLSIDGDEAVGQILKNLARTDLQALPVLHGDELQGVVRSDQMLEIMEEETTEDIFKQAGINVDDEYSKSERVLNASVMEAVKIRTPWLLFALAGGMIAAGVMEAFETTLQTLVILAFFIPAIMDMGGNVGTQSSTISVRGLILGQIDSSDFYREMGREALVGLTIGLITGALAAAIAFIWQGSLLVSAVLLISMSLTCSLASLIGHIIPLAAHKYGYDPASVSDPLVTTIKDITALLIYFGVATLLLSL